jgi:preprotein translocase subunit YajC
VRRVPLLPLSIAERSLFVDGLIGVLPLIGIALVFWLLIIRPASRRNKDMRTMQSALSVGDQVMLTSGFFGTVRAVHDDRLEIELAPGIVVTVAKGAVGSVVPRPGDDVIPSRDEKPTDTTETSEPSDPEER